MKRLLVLLSLAATTFLTGCAATTPTIQSTVTAFHVWNTALTDKSFRIIPNAEQASSLEFQTYKRYVEDALLLQNFTEKPANQTAHFNVTFSYSIKPSTRTVMQPREMVDPFGPMYPRWPYQGPFGFPNAGPWGYPYAGPFGYQDMVPVVIDVYERQFKLNMTDSSTQNLVYEVTVNNVGQSPDMAYIMPYLVRSAFQNFPGPNGTPQVITLEMNEPAGK
jgi:hypothetical protein